MNPDLRRRRLVAYAIGVIATAALAGACGSGGGHSPGAAHKDPPTQKYSDSYVSFRYPAAWKALRFRRPLELHSFPLVYLSTQAIHSPCSTHGNETTCGWPIKRLQPGGVLAVWQFPYAPPCPGCSSREAGKPVRIGGRDAMRQELGGGVCRAIGADRTIEVTIKDSSAPAFMACIRGPGVAQSERRVDAMLRSTQFPAQSSSTQTS
jgi:hypothetical protein